MKISKNFIQIIILLVIILLLAIITYFNKDNFVKSNTAEILKGDSRIISTAKGPAYNFI